MLRLGFILSALIGAVLAPFAYEIAATRYLIANWRNEFVCPGEVHCNLAAQEIAQVVSQYDAGIVLWMSAPLLFLIHMIAWRSVSSPIRALVLIAALSGVLGFIAASAGFFLQGAASDSPEWEASVAFGDELAIVAAIVFATCGLVTGGVGAWLTRANQARLSKS